MKRVYPFLLGVIVYLRRLCADSAGAKYEQELGQWKSSY